MTLNIHYWPIRGLNEPIVTLAEHFGLNYKLHSVESRETWLKEKEDLVKKGFDFPNLPYTEKNGKYLSESLAIMAQVAVEAGKLDYLPSQSQLTEFLEISGVISDINQGVTNPAYIAKSLDDLKEKVNANLLRHQAKLSALSDNLAKQKWLLGEHLTILDFRFAETVERMKIMNNELGLNNFNIDFSSLEAFLTRFLDLSGVKEYRSSGRFKARPFNNTQAVWK